MQRIGLFTLILVLLFMISVGCDLDLFDSDDDYVDTEKGTIRFELQDEDYTIDAEFYVFMGVMSDDEEVSFYTTPVPWEVLESNDWKHEQSGLDYGEWTIGVYAVTESVEMEDFDPSSDIVVRMKSDIHYTVNVQRELNLPISIDLDGGEVSFAGKDGIVQFIIPVAEQEDEDTFYTVTAYFYWDQEDTKSLVWNWDHDYIDTSIGTAYRYSAANYVVSEDDEGKDIHITTDALASGRWAFHVAAWHTDDYGNPDVVPEQLRAAIMQYVRVMDNEASSPQEVYVDLEVH